MPDCDAAACRVTTIGKCMTDLGHDVTFLSWGGKYKDKDREESDDYKFMGMKYVITNEIDGVGLKDKLVKKFSLGNKTLKYIKNLDWTPDAIVAYNTPFGFNKKLIRYCRKHKVKLISDITEWYDSNELNSIDNFLNSLNMEKIQKRIKNKIVISRFLNNYYSESHNIIIPPLSFLTRIQTKGEGPSINLIYAGNPAKKDKLHTFINVVNKLSKDDIPFIFRIVGITKEKYLQSYSEFLDDTDLSNNIKFYGRVSHEDIPNYYSESDFMLLLRDSNRKSNAGFPTKFAESMCMGVPVITNPTSDLGKYVNNGVNGYLLENTDPESIEKFMRELHETLTREKIQDMKVNAAETGEEYFSLNSCKSDLNTFLNNLS